jgi:predicted DNA-binding transcriptional regulator YafY
VDRIRDIELLETPAKPQRQVQGLESGFSLPKHMAEHIYMFGGESQHITMRTTPGMAGELIDWFGNGVAFTEETEDSVVAHVTANLESMRFWALQYASYVTILSPQKLVDAVRNDLQYAVRKYNEERANT